MVLGSSLDVSTKLGIYKNWIRKVGIISFKRNFWWAKIIK